VHGFFNFSIGMDSFQYLTTGTGTFTSFNANGGRYILTNRCYRTCVRLGQGFCSVAFTADPFAIGIYITGSCANHGVGDT